MKKAGLFHWPTALGQRRGEIQDRWPDWPCWGGGRLPLLEQEGSKRGTEEKVRELSLKVEQCGLPCWRSG